MANIVLAVVVLISCAWAASACTCFSGYTELKNLQVLGGKDQSINNLGGCKKKCEQMGVNCQAIDWNKKRKACYTFASSGGLLKENNDVDRYTQCRPCVSGFWVIKDYQVMGGKDQKISSEATCKSKCKADSKCTALDWNKTRKACYFFTEADNNGKYVANKDVDRLVKCG